MPTRHHTNHSATARRQAACHSDDWRCTRCFKLLGKRDENRVRLRFARGHQYDCSVPVTAVCRCCGTLNELLKLN